MLILEKKSQIKTLNSTLINGKHTEGESNKYEQESMKIEKSMKEKEPSLEKKLRRILPDLINK